MAASSAHRRILYMRAAWLIGLYAIAYLVASWLDLTTTALALHRPEASEGNVYSTGAAGYVALRAWLITIIGGVAIEACLAWSIIASSDVTEGWLAHPIRSWAKFYVNPWARSVRDRSPLHMMSFVIAFVPLRLIAALNNAVIASTGSAPLGKLVALVSRATTPTLGFWFVLGPLFYLCAIAVTPPAARLVIWLRKAE
jgi:hypothetical protein